MTTRVALKKTAKGYRIEIEAGQMRHTAEYTNLSRALASLRDWRGDYDKGLERGPLYLYYFPRSEPLLVIHAGEPGMVRSMMVLESNDASDAWLTFEVYAQMLAGR